MMPRSGAMNILNKILGVNVRKGRRDYQRRKLTPKEKMLENTRYIQRIIQRGDYRPEYYQHRVKAQRAIKEGYLDKDLNILKEA